MRGFPTSVEVTSQVKASLCSLLVIVILILAITRCPVGVAVPFLADASEGAFRLRWKLDVEDLAGASIRSFTLQTSRDGRRTLVGYSANVTSAIIVDENGKRVLTGPASTYPYPTLSAISSDGRVLIVSIEGGEEEDSILAWYDVDTRQQVQNASLGMGATIHSLAISDDASLVAVSGVVWSNYTFIHAFDSQGRRLWSHVGKARELVGYHEFSYKLSTVAVSGEGNYVAAALRDMTVRFWGVCGGNNGVVLFNKQGEAAWNYSDPECVWNVAISGDGRRVAAVSSSQLYAFGGMGELLWSRIFSGGTFALSDNGQRLVAGNYEGNLLLADESGPYWKTQGNGFVESVGISDSGDTSAAVVSRSDSSAPTARLVYVLNDQGRLLLNYSSTGPTGALGASRVAVSGNGCCIVAALETDGVYYFEKTRSETRTTAIPEPTDTNTSVETGSIQIAVTVLLLGLLGLIIAIHRRQIQRKKQQRAQ